LRNIATILLLCCPWVHAADRYVNADGVCGGLSPCHTTITLAVAAIDATPTTIHVQGDGPYDEHGLQLAATCANRTVVIDGAGPTTVITTTDGTDAGVILPKAAAVTAAITISNCTLKLGSATSSCVFLNGETWLATSSLTLDTVVFDQDHVADSRAVTLFSNAAGGSLTLRNCSITDDANSDPSIYVQYLSSLTCDNVDFGSTGGSVGIYLYQQMGQVSITGCSFARVGMGFVDVRPATASASGAVIRVHGCEVSGLYLLRNQYGMGGSGNNYNAVIEDSQLIRYGTMTGISWGRDKPWSEHDYCGRVTIRGNTISTHTSATGAHAILVGGGCDAAAIEDNTITDTVAGPNSYQIVSKARGTKIRGNKIYGPRGVYLVSGQGCAAEHNTIYATAVTADTSWGVKWWTQTTTHGGLPAALTGAAGTAPDNTVILHANAKTEAGADGYWVGAILTMNNGALSGQKAVIKGYVHNSNVATLGAWAPWNITGLTGNPADGDQYKLARFRSVTVDANAIQNNIIVADGASTYCLHDGTPADGSKNNLVDYNCYWALNGGKLASIGGADKTTVATLIAAYTGVSAYNDANSLEADPLLKSPSAGNFAIPFTSAALNAASDGTNIGAHQHRAYPPR
jgi:hypothetical protein